MNQALHLPRTVNAPQMKFINRAAILELVRQCSPISRSEIAGRLDLSLPTVIRIVDELIEEGFISSIVTKDWSGGRKRELLEYNEEGFAVIGLDLGGTKMYGALSNLGGKVLAEVQVNQHGTRGVESFKKLSGLIQELIDQAHGLGKNIRGIAVGAPGIVHNPGGLVEFAPSLDWKNFPLQEKLQTRFTYPIRVENDVNLAVLGEYWFGASRFSDNMILIAVGTGLGAGIIFKGELYRGTHESAGEIAYLAPNSLALGKEYAHYGPMEQLVSGAGIAERAREKLADRANPEEIKSLTAADVFDRASRGEDWAKVIVQETIDHLSMILVDLTSILDPEVIILSGSVSKDFELLIPGVLEKIRDVLPHVPRIEISQLGHRAAVLGAISLVLSNTTNNLVVHQVR